MNTLTRLELCLATLVFACLLALMAIGVPAFGAGIDRLHTVDPSGLILRGPEPRSKVGELRRLKVNHVLIIKRQLKNEVDRELEALRDLGIRSTYIPMEWKNADVKKLCFEVVEAVQFLQKQKRAGKRTYFHCTYGEDRTGTVAGLFRMVDQGWSAQRAFRDEMCARGYADGGSKPAYINREIEKSLTPIFFALSKNIGPQGLNSSVCNHVTIPARVRTCADVQSY